MLCPPPVPRRSNLTAAPFHGPIIPIDGHGTGCYLDPGGWKGGIWRLDPLNWKKGCGKVTGWPMGRLGATKSMANPLARDYWTNSKEKKHFEFREEVNIDLKPTNQKNQPNSTKKDSYRGEPGKLILKKIDESVFGNVFGNMVFDVYVYYILYYYYVFIYIYLLLLYVIVVVIIIMYFFTFLFRGNILIFE